MSEHTVDVIVPVHSPSRPVARAVASVIESTAAQTRVIVVAHNVDPDSIRAALGGFATHPAVKVLGLQDGVRPLLALATTASSTRPHPTSPSSTPTTP